MLAPVGNAGKWTSCLPETEGEFCSKIHDQDDDEWQLFGISIPERENYGLAVTEILAFSLVDFDDYGMQDLQLHTAY